MAALPAPFSSPLAVHLQPQLLPRPLLSVLTAPHHPTVREPFAFAPLVAVAHKSPFPSPLAAVVDASTKFSDLRLSMVRPLTDVSVRYSRRFCPLTHAERLAVAAQPDQLDGVRVGWTVSAATATHRIAVTYLHGDVLVAQDPLTTQLRHGCPNVHTAAATILHLVAFHASASEVAPGLVAAVAACPDGELRFARGVTLASNLEQHGPLTVS